MGAVGGTLPSHSHVHTYFSGFRNSSNLSAQNILNSENLKAEKYALSHLCRRALRYLHRRIKKITISRNYRFRVIIKVVNQAH